MFLNRNMTGSSGDSSSRLDSRNCNIIALVATVFNVFKGVVIDLRKGWHEDSGPNDFPSRRGATNAGGRRFFEAFGDSLFQAGLYRTTGVARVLSFSGGVGVLALYGLVVNLPRWDFGRLLGVYVVLFFLMAQILAKVRFNQSPTPPILLGGLLIVIGGLIVTFAKAEEIRFSLPSQRSAHLPLDKPD